ncbi:MAG: hypothetical protein JXB62_14465 [Pirellulales bacterium]|nr:hypothetical protein [Pirellulales bacterium]
MANVEGDNPEFEQLDDLFGEDPTEDEPLGDLEPAGELDLGVAGAAGALSAGALDLDAQAEDEESQLEEQPSKKGKKKRKKKKRGKDQKELKKKDDSGKDSKPSKKQPGQGGGLLAAVTKADLFTVMLAVALLAIAIAVLCLFKELWKYDFEIKAKPPVVTAPEIHPGPASTALAAWPIVVQLTSRAGAGEDDSGSSQIT